MDKDLNIVKENQAAIFNLLGELYHKITGDIPSVKIQTDGGILILSPSEYAVISREEVLQNSSESQKVKSTTS